MQINSKDIIKDFYLWIPMAIVIVLLSFLTYGLVQQNIRLGTYELPIQASEDISNSLEQGANISDVTPIGIVDPSKSLDTFVIIYDNNGKAVASSISLNGKTPLLPNGVLSYTKANKEDRITWQPENGVRIATVITYYTQGKNSGYVLAGKSLKETENIEEIILRDTLSGCLITLIASLVATIVVREYFIKEK